MTTELARRLLVVHPHLHRRRTGVARHLESVIPASPPTLEARWFGGALLAPNRIAWAELWSRLRRERAVWHAHRNNEMLLGLLFRWLGKDVRLVYTRHASTRPSWLTRWLFRRADACVTLTDEVSRTLAVPATQVHHGVDTRAFFPSERRAASWERLGLGGLHGVGVIGRIRPAKGQGDFAEAAAPLLERFPQWRGVLVGRVKPRDVAFFESLRARARLVHVPEQVDILPWYQGLTVLVQPSHHEGLSMVLLEAMASGCCVVATRLPSYPDFIVDGRNCLLYPPGDVSALRALLESLMQDPARAEAIGRQAAEDARRRFDVAREAEALAALYASLFGAER